MGMKDKISKADFDLITSKMIEAKLDYYSSMSISTKELTSNIYDIAEYFSNRGYRVIGNSEVINISW